jgi:hypothetical protein
MTGKGTKKNSIHGQVFGVGEVHTAKEINLHQETDGDIRKYFGKSIKFGATGTQSASKRPADDEEIRSVAAKRRRTKD